MKRSYPFNNGGPQQGGAGSSSNAALGKSAAAAVGVGGAGAAGPNPSAYANYGYAGAVQAGSSAPAHAQPAPTSSLSHDQQQAQWHQQWQQYYAQQAASAAGTSHQQGTQYSPHQAGYQHAAQPPSAPYAHQPAPQSYPPQPYYPQPNAAYGAPHQAAHDPYPQHQHAYTAGPPIGAMAPSHAGPMSSLGMTQTLRIGPTTTHGTGPPLGPQTPHAGGPHSRSYSHGHGPAQGPAPPGTYTPMGTGSGFAAPMAGPQPPSHHQHHQGGPPHHHSHHQQRDQHQHHSSGPRNAKRARYDGPAGPGVGMAGHSSLPAPPTGPTGGSRMGSGGGGGGARAHVPSSPAGSSRSGGPGVGAPSGPRGGGYGPGRGGPPGGGREYGGRLGPGPGPGQGPGMMRVPAGPRGPGAGAHPRAPSYAGSDDSRFGGGRERDRYGGRHGPASGGGRLGPAPQQRGGGGMGAGRAHSGTGSSYMPSGSGSSSGREGRQRSPLSSRHAGKDGRGSGSNAGTGAGGGRDRDRDGSNSRHAQSSQSAAFANRSADGGSGGVASSSGVNGKPSASGSSSVAVPTGPKAKGEANRRSTTDMRVVGLSISGAISWAWTLDQGTVGAEGPTDSTAAPPSRRGSESQRGGGGGVDDEARDENGDDKDEDEEDEEHDASDDGGEEDESVKAEEVAMETGRDQPSVAESQDADAQHSPKPVEKDDGQGDEAAQVSAANAVKEEAQAAVGDAAAPDQGSTAASLAESASGPAQAPSTRPVTDAAVVENKPRTTTTRNKNEQAEGKQGSRRTHSTHQADSCRLRLCFGVPVPPAPQAELAGAEVGGSSAKAEDAPSSSAEGGAHSGVESAGAAESTEAAPSTGDVDMNGHAEADSSKEVKPELDASADKNGTHLAKAVPDPGPTDASVQDETSPKDDNDWRWHDFASWSPLSKAPPQPNPNRVSITYANGQKRIHIDAESILSLRVFREERRVEIDVDTRSAAYAASLEGTAAQAGEKGGKVQDWVVTKGVLLEARSDEQRNYGPISVAQLRAAYEADTADIQMEEKEVPSQADAAAETSSTTGVAQKSQADADALALKDLPPLHQLRSADSEVSEMTMFVVHLDRNYPVRQAEWLRTGDVEEFLSSYESLSSTSGPESAAIPNPWRHKIYVVDPDPEPTIDDILQLWAAKAYTGNGRERRRFLREYFDVASQEGSKDGDSTSQGGHSYGLGLGLWSLGQVFGRLGLGKGERYVAPSTTAAKLRSGSSRGPHPFTLAAQTDVFGPGHAQSVAGLASVALVDLVQELALEVGWAEADLRARLGQMLLGLPQHTLFRALDSLFKDYSDMMREREREAARAAKVRAEEEEERAKAKKAQAQAEAKAAKAAEASAAAAAEEEDQEAQSSKAASGAENNADRSTAARQDEPAAKDESENAGTNHAQEQEVSMETSNEKDNDDEATQEGAEGASHEARTEAEEAEATASSPRAQDATMADTAEAAATTAEEKQDDASGGDASEEVKEGSAGQGEPS